jgi:DNA-binding MarR family transcriptional regulator
VNAPLEELLWENRRLFRTLAAAADRALAPLGIQAGDRALLEFLARETGPVSLSELARKRSVSRQHIHQSLGRLQRRKWISKSPDPSDARSVLLEFTVEGRAAWRRIRAVDRTLLAAIRTRVSARAAAQAASTLRAVRSALE